jgi:hypothetical protein
MTREQALTQALALAIAAPTEEQRDRAVELAESIAAGMSEIEVARAKQAATELADMPDKNKIVQTSVTDRQLWEETGGCGPRSEEFIWVRCPSYYDVDRITAADIVHDDAITVVKP